MTFDEEIQDVLHAGSAWSGDSDGLWQQVADGIRRRQAREPARRWWRPVSMWSGATATALAATAVLAVWLEWPGTAPPGPGVGGMSVPAAGGAGRATAPSPLDAGAGQHSAKPGAESPPDKVKQVAPNAAAPAEAPAATAAQAPATTTPKAENGPGITAEQAQRPQPPPPLYDFAITPEREVYPAGEPVRLTLQFRNVSGEPMRLAGEPPRLFVGLMTAPYDNGNPAGEAIPLPGLAGRTLAPDETVTATVVWPGAEQPGWYRAILGRFSFQAGPWQGTAGGGEGRFRIAHPPGQVRVGDITPGARASAHGFTVTIRRVEFSERETKVFFHITGLRAPAEFGLALVRPDGSQEGALLGRSHRDSPEGGIEGVAEFNPTPASTRSLTIEVPDLSVVHVGQGMERLAGPWRVEIPLAGAP